MNWKRGITLMTPTTKRWSKEQIEKNDSIEQTMIFSNFSAMDFGTGRQLVCTLNRNNLDYEKNAKLIEAAPEMFEALKRVEAYLVENEDVLAPFPTRSELDNIRAAMFKTGLYQYGG